MECRDIRFPEKTISLGVPRIKKYFKSPESMKIFVKCIPKYFTKHPMLSEDEIEFGKWQIRKYQMCNSCILVTL